MERGSDREGEGCKRGSDTKNEGLRQKAYTE